MSHSGGNDAIPLRIGAAHDRLLDKDISLSVCYNTDLGVAWLLVYCAEFGRYQYCQYQDTAAILQIHVLCSMYWYGAGTGGLEYGSCADLALPWPTMRRVSTGTDSIETQHENI